MNTPVWRGIEWFKERQKRSSACFARERNVKRISETNDVSPMKGQWNVFPLKNLFFYSLTVSIQTLVHGLIESIFLKNPVLLWDAEEGPNHHLVIKAHQIVLNQCWKCTPTNHPPSMNSHRGYNITGKFARLDSIFTLYSHCIIFKEFQSHSITYIWNRDKDKIFSTL